MSGGDKPPGPRVSLRPTCKSPRFDASETEDLKLDNFTFYEGQMSQTSQIEGKLVSGRKLSGVELKSWLFGITSSIYNVIYSDN